MTDHLARLGARSLGHPASSPRPARVPVPMARGGRLPEADDIELPVEPPTAQDPEAAGPSAQPVGHARAVGLEAAVDRGEDGRGQAPLTRSAPVVASSAIERVSGPEAPAPPGPASSGPRPVLAPALAGAEPVRPAVLNRPTAGDWLPRAVDPGGFDTGGSGTHADAGVFGTGEEWPLAKARPGTADTRSPVTVAAAVAPTSLPTVVQVKPRPDVRSVGLAPSTMPDEAQVIRVSIGRIEVRAPQAPPPPAAAPERQGPGTLSLDDYLRRRQEGRGGR